MITTNQNLGIILLVLSFYKQDRFTLMKNMFAIMKRYSLPKVLAKELECLKLKRLVFKENPS